MHSDFPRFTEEYSRLSSGNTDYDQYYASLAASADPSASQTPLPLGVDEEDQKPNVDYLDYVNNFNKRSRSAEDIGGDGRKVPKVDEVVTNGVNGHGILTNGHGISNGMPVDETVAPTPSAGGADDDPIVYGAFNS